jgi:hypothetical protein
MVVEGGSTLVFWGYPVEIDTRQAGASLAVAPTTRWHGLQVLMPANWAVETSNGTFWLLILDLDGAISGDPDMPNAYEVSTVPRLALVAA